MNDRDALMRAIRANPADDTPRLVYADWLDDYGGPADRARARFIRLQCDAARLPADDPRRAAARREADDLLNEHSADWLAALLATDWPDPPEPLTFARGFLTDLPVVTTECDFAAVADHFLRWEHVDTVTLSGSPAGVTAAASHPAMGLVGSVRITGPDGDAGAAGAWDDTLPALAAVPRQTPLLELQVTRADLTDAAAFPLTTAPAFGQLSRLILNRVRFTPDGLARFRGAVFARGLRGLAIDQHPWTWPPAERGREVAAAFAEGGYDALDGFGMGGYALGDDGLLALTASPLARRLTWFRLQGDRNLFGAGVAALFDRDRWPALTTLDLMPVHLDENDLAPLVSGDRFATLDTFRAFVAAGTPDTAARLAANPHVAGLKTLELTGRWLGDGGARALMASPYLTGLRRLGLNELSDDLLRAFADPAVFPELRELQVTRSWPSPEGLRAELQHRFGRGLDMD